MPEARRIAKSWKGIDFQNGYDEKAVNISQELQISLSVVQVHKKWFDLQ
jgi:hypothetical protein